MNFSLVGSQRRTLLNGLVLHYIHEIAPAGACGEGLGSLLVPRRGVAVHHSPW